MIIPFPPFPTWLAPKDLESHRRWGLRAFAMGIASFEYRVFLYAGDAWRVGFAVAFYTGETVKPMVKPMVIRKHK